MKDLQQLQQYYEQTLCDKIGQAQRAQTDWLGFCKDAGTIGYEQRLTASACLCYNQRTQWAFSMLLF